MAYRLIRTEEDPVLQKVSKPVVAFDAKLHLLLNDMKDTLAKADGVGLAAVQIGILRRVVLIDVGDEHGFIEAINGEIIERKSKRGHVFYGCGNWPKCNFMSWDAPAGENCPDCGKSLFKKKTGKLVCMTEGCGYEKAVSGKKKNNE